VPISSARARRERRKREVNPWYRNYTPADPGAALTFRARLGGGALRVRVKRSANPWSRNRSGGESVVTLSLKLCQF
jgi:hypothetical protein